MEFFSAPQRAPVRSFAVLVFAWHNNQVLLCDIENRGWCNPGGRVEPKESTLEAARRETLEEAGALLGPMQYIGCYRIVENHPQKKQIRWADAYVANVDKLVAIDPAFESKGRKFFGVEELPEVYYHWTELVSEVFLYSKEVLARYERIQQEYLS
jgi:8-oxo-dGTP pyrophosphatase MutT (NUDIX family)